MNLVKVNKYIKDFEKTISNKSSVFLKSMDLSGAANGITTIPSILNIVRSYFTHIVENKKRFEKSPHFVFINVLRLLTNDTMDTVKRRENF